MTSRHTTETSTENGLSALRVSAPIFAALQRRNGLELLGSATLKLLSESAGRPLPVRGRIQADENGEITILAESIRAILRPHDGPHHGADNGTPIGSPIPPLDWKEKERKSIPSLQSQVHQEGRNGIPSKAPSFEEWETQAHYIGWKDPIAIRETYDWKTNTVHGWADCRSWKRLCTCLANNWRSKTARTHRLEGAFGGTT